MAMKGMSPDCPMNASPQSCCAHAIASMAAPMAAAEKPRLPAIYTAAASFTARPQVRLVAAAPLFTPGSFLDSSLNILDRALRI